MTRVFRLYMNNEIAIEIIDKLSSIFEDGKSIFIFIFAVKIEPRWLLGDSNTFTNKIMFVVPHIGQNA